MVDKNARTARFRILVKAFPQPSKKYQETVCCAGIEEGSGNLLRLYPIRFRSLPREKRFDRFDLVEMRVRKDPDPRPESYHVEEDSIRLIEPGRNMADGAKVRLWAPHVYSSLDALQESYRRIQTSLGIVRPDAGSLVFEAKAAHNSEDDDSEMRELVYRQQSLLEESLKPLPEPTHSFAYKYTSGGKPHRHEIHDWEVQATFIRYKERYKGEAGALAMMQREFGDMIPQRNLHFIMGSIAQRPYQFIVIGLLRSPIDPEAAAKQGNLFD